MATWLNVYVLAGQIFIDNNWGIETYNGVEEIVKVE